MIVSLDSVSCLPVGPRAIGAGVTRWLTAEGLPVAVPALDNSSDADVPRCFGVPWRSCAGLASEEGARCRAVLTGPERADTGPASVSYSGGTKGGHPGRELHGRGRTAIEVYSELFTVYQDARRV